MRQENYHFNIEHTTVEKMCVGEHAKQTWIAWVRDGLEYCLYWRCGMYRDDDEIKGEMTAKLVRAKRRSLILLVQIFGLGITKHADFEPRNVGSLRIADRAEIELYHSLVRAEVVAIEYDLLRKLRVSSQYLPQCSFSAQSATVDEKSNFQRT